MLTFKQCRYIIQHLNHEYYNILESTCYPIHQVSCPKTCGSVEVVIDNKLSATLMDGGKEAEVFRIRVMTLWTCYSAFIKVKHKIGSISIYLGKKFNKEVFRILFAKQVCCPV